MEHIEEKNAMVEVRENAPPPSIALIKQAIENNMSIEQLIQVEKMLDIMVQADKEFARKEFFKALADFKEVAPSVKKDAHNKYFDSYYTTLGCLLETYNPVLGKFGLSVSFPTPKQTDNSMTVECRVSHRDGHQESVTMTAPIDHAAIGNLTGKRSRNAIQDIKSTFTYLRSVTLEAALGVSGTEASAFDDDGNSAGDSYLSEDDLTAINTLIEKKNVDVERFLKYMKVSKVEEIKTRDYKNALLALAVAKGKNDVDPEEKKEEPKKDDNSK